MHDVLESDQVHNLYVTVIGAAAAEPPYPGQIGVLQLSTLTPS